MKNLKEKCLAKKNGITLIALVITIIILLILATITIVELRNTKLFNKTIETRNKYKQSAEEENNILLDYENYFNQYESNIPERFYTITYNLNGGTNSENNPTKYKQGDEITLEMPTKDGYIFTGWTEGDKNITAINRETRGNKTFTANWKTALEAITLGQIVNYSPIVGSYFNEPTSTSNYYRRSNNDENYVKFGNEYQIVNIDTNNKTIQITTKEPSNEFLTIANLSTWHEDPSLDYLNDLCKYFYGKNNITIDVRSVKYSDKSNFNSSALTTNNEFWLADHDNRTGGYWQIKYVDNNNNWEGCKFIVQDRAYGSRGPTSVSMPIRPLITISFSSISKIENNIIYIK